MLIEQTLEQLRGLKLYAMAEGLEHQRLNASLQAASFEDRLAMLVEAERLARENRRLSRLLKNARLKEAASPEAVDYKTPRGLDKLQLTALLTCNWISKDQNLIIMGPTGVGKTWIACALGNQAARLGITVMYRRFGRLLEEFAIAREDGSLPKLWESINKAKLLILDDWGLAQLSTSSRQDLLDLVDDRMGSGSLIITSQLPISGWHEYIGDPTIADAILDRLVHSSHRIELKGESLRKLRGKPE